MREEIYPTRVDPGKLIDLLDSLDDAVVKNMTAG